MTGTLTCSTTAVSTSPVGVYPISLCSGLADAGFAVVYDYANSDYTVTKAPLTVTADDKSRLFGAANPPLTATLSGFVLGQTLATSGVTGSAACTTNAMPFSAGRDVPDHLHGGLARPRRTTASRPFVAGTLTVGYSQPCITDDAGRRAGRSRRGRRCASRAGATISGGVTVQAGGALDIEGGTVTGGLRSTGASGAPPLRLDRVGRDHDHRHDGARADRRRRGHRPVRREHPHQHGHDDRQLGRRRVQQQHRHRRPDDHRQHGHPAPAGHGLRCTWSATRSAARATSSRRSVSAERGDGSAARPRSRSSRSKCSSA